MVMVKSFEEQRDLFIDFRDIDNARSQRCIACFSLFTSSSPTTGLDLKWSNDPCRKVKYDSR